MENIFVLTARQSQVILLIARGWRRGEIAEELGISRKTVDIHIGAACKRLNITRGTQSVMIVRMALEKGWIGVEDIR